MPMPDLLFTILTNFKAINPSHAHPPLHDLLLDEVVVEDAGHAGVQPLTGGDIHAHHAAPLSLLLRIQTFAGRALTQEEKPQEKPSRRIALPLDSIVVLGRM